MKNLFLSIFVLIFALPLAANAASFSLSPSTGSFTPGQTFNVTVFVNPVAGESVYTAKLSAAFPADLVEVISFSHASGWMALSQVGYDSTDNTNGKLVKTGGYPEGASTNTKFGTITLRAKSSGNATVSVTSDSMMLNNFNMDIHTASSGGTFVVAGRAPVPVPAPATTPAPTELEVTTAEIQEEVEPSSAKATEGKEDEIMDDEDPLTTGDQVAAAAAAAAGSDSGNIGKALLYSILGFLVFVLMGAFVWRASKNN